MYNGEWGAGGQELLAGSAKKNLDLDSEFFFKVIPKAQCLSLNVLWQLVCCMSRHLDQVVFWVNPVWKKKKKHSFPHAKPFSQ